MSRCAGSKRENSISLAQGDAMKIKCLETEGCNGYQEQFAYIKQGDSESRQFKCNQCHKYLRQINGKFYSAGKYNLTEET